jgi:hypothetical protein
MGENPEVLGYKQKSTRAVWGSLVTIAHYCPFSPPVTVASPERLKQQGYDRARSAGMENQST